MKALRLKSKYFTEAIPCNFYYCYHNLLHQDGKSAILDNYIYILF